MTAKAISLREAALAASIRDTEIRGTLSMNGSRSRLTVVAGRPSLVISPFGNYHSVEVAVGRQNGSKVLEILHHATVKVKNGDGDRVVELDGFEVRLQQALNSAD